MTPERIVSLLPGATEIVCALGLGSRLVGRSHECDFPPEVERLPACSGPRLDPSASGHAIDAGVRDLVSRGLAVFEVDAERLREVAPEVIVTQIQCEVCAVSEGEVRAAVDCWLDAAPTLVSTEASSLPGVWDDIVRVGTALGARPAADSLVDSLTARLDALSAVTDGAGTRPSVVCIEWVEPLMSSGNWMPALVAKAGGVNLLAEADAHSPWIEWGDVLAADPDVLVVSPCGFDLERAAVAAEPLAKLPGWHDLSAVRKGAVFAVDGHQYLHRPGPRLVESAIVLAHVLHPDLEGLPPAPEHAFTRIPTAASR